MIKALYSISLFFTGNLKHRACSVITPSKLVMTNLGLDALELEELSTYTSQALVGSKMDPCVNVEDSTAFGMAGSSGMIHSTKKPVNI